MEVDFPARCAEECDAAPKTRRRWSSRHAQSESDPVQEGWTLTASSTQVDYPTECDTDAEVVPPEQQPFKMRAQTDGEQTIQKEEPTASHTASAGPVPSDFRPMEVDCPPCASQDQVVGTQPAEQQLGCSPGQQEVVGPTSDNFATVRAETEVMTRMVEEVANELMGSFVNQFGEQPEACPGEGRQASGRPGPGVKKECTMEVKGGGGCGTSTCPPNPGVTTTETLAQVKEADDGATGLQAEEEEENTGIGFTAPVSCTQAIQATASDMRPAVCLDSLRERLAEANSLTVLDAPPEVPETTGVEDPYDYDSDDGGQAGVPANRIDLADLCTRVAADRATLGHVKRRKVVIVLGKTGAGKTTFLHFIAQRRLEKSRHCEKDVFVATEAMDGFTIGHDQASETKSIRHYERVCQGGSEPVVYLDTPGYKDSDGPLVDLATSVSFRKVASVCGQLRFVVLINTASFLERGEAIKDVASLISSFVGDFDEHRFVFTFLFTHTGSLKETEGVSLSTVKAKLVVWLEETRKGTKCIKTKEVLGWMKSCLQKQHPFVDIFHPEYSTTESLVAMVEKFEMLQGGRQAALGLKKGKSAREVVRCGMTVAEEGTLKLELNSLLVKLRDALQNERLRVFPGLVKILVDLHENIGNKVTRTAWDEGEALLKRKVESLVAEIRRLMLQGTDPSHSFSVEMGRRSMECMAVLDALSDLHMADILPQDAGQRSLCQLRSGLEELLHTSCTELGDPGHRDLATIVTRLQRMQVWADAHVEFAPICRAGLDATGAWIAAAVQAACEKDDEESLVSALGRLQLVLLQSDGLKRLGLPTEAAEEAAGRLSDRLSQRIAETFSQAEAAIKQVQVHGAEGESLEEPLRIFQSQSANLERLAHLLQGTLTLRELDQAAASARSTLLEEVHRMVRGLYERVVAGTTGASSCSMDSMNEIKWSVSTFHAILGHLTDCQHSKTSGNLLFEDALQQMLAEVERLAAGIHQRCEMLHTSGVGMPEEHVQPLQALTQWVWLDRFSEGSRPALEKDSRSAPEKQSVTVLLTQFEGRYSEHFQESAQAVIRALTEYLEKPQGHEECVTVMKRKLPQVRCALQLVPVFPGMESLLPDLETQLYKLIEGWSNGRQQEGPQSADESLASLDASGDTLRVCSTLSFLKAHGCGSTLEELSRSVQTQLQPYVEHASSLMSAQRRFQEKREFLDRLTSWEENGLTDLLELFPTLASFRASAKMEVEALDSRAQAAVKDCTDLELAESLLQQLKEAQHLDDYFAGMAGRSFVLLQQLLEVQQTELEKALREKVESCNFAGIKDHVTPLVDSHNPLAKEQLRKVVESIRCSVNSREAAACASLQSGPEVAKHISVLEAAADEVGSLLLQHTSTDVHEAVHKLKNCVTEQCQERLMRLEAVLDPLDGRFLVPRCQDAQSYINAVSCIVGAQFFARLGSITQKALCRLKRVTPLCETFLQKVSRSDEHVDTSELVELLHQLRLAGKSADTPDKAVTTPLEVKTWLVKNTGGVNVYDSEGRELPERLAHGSLVAELDRDGDWVKYVRLTRDGPERGWVRTWAQGWWRRENHLVEVDKLWEVSMSSTGVVCQSAQDPSSTRIRKLLAAGAQVKQLELHGDRLKFELLTGEGPATGWTHITQNGEEILTPLHMSETNDTLTAQRCADLHDAAAWRLGQGLNALHRQVCRGMSENHLHLMAIRVYTNLKTEVVEGGVLSHASGLEFDVSVELDKAREVQQETAAVQKRHLEKNWSVDNIDKTWVPLLSKLYADSRSIKSFYGYWALPEYKDKCTLLACAVQDILSQTQSQLKAEDFYRAGSLAILLFHACKRLRDHIEDPLAKAAPETLTADVKQCFQKFHGDLGEALSGGNVGAFEMLFLRYHQFMHHFAPTFKALPGAACRLHEDLLKALETRGQSLRDKIEHLNFVAAAEEVRALRNFGRVLTGAFAVYQEDLRRLVNDDWLRRIGQFSTKHFGGKALAGLGPHFAVLQVQPNASRDQIKKAYLDRSREYHPDTHARRGIQHINPSAMQQRVQEAYDELMKPTVLEEYNRGLSEPFSVDIRELQKTLPQRLEIAFTEANYKRVQELLVSSEHLHILGNMARPELDSKSVCCQMHELVEGHVAAMHKSLFTNWDNRKLENLQEDLAKVTEMEKHLSAQRGISCGDEHRKIKKAVEMEILEVSRQGLADLSDKTPPEAARMHFALPLVRLGHILDHLPQLKDFTVMTINSMLEFCQTKVWGHTFLFHVGILLERGCVGQPDDTGTISSEDQRISRVIVSEFRQFKEVLTVVWNEQTAVTQKDVSATVCEIVANKVTRLGTTELVINRDRLLKCHELYSTEYEKIFLRWVSGQLDLTTLVSETKAAASDLPVCHTNNWTPCIREAIPKLLAHVFAYFTISESGQSYTRLTEFSTGVDDSDFADENALKPDNVLKKPHSTQVISILQMLGCEDSEGARLNSHLMQIRTGEGKSMLLGGCAVVLGLLGFRVRTVCYSEYLSQRDSNLFHEVFAAFGVTDSVTYGKITSLCEDNIAAKGDPRALTLDLIQGVKSGPGQICDFPRTDKEEILLVDEVDVFFGPDFYGKTHNLVAELANPEVRQILREVWRSRTEAPNPQAVLARVKALSCYQKLLESFPTWQFLIDSEVEAMCHDLNNFDTPPYHFNERTQKVGYQSLDSVDYDIVYGYRTAFAYLNEESKKNIRDPDAVLGRALCLRVPCGQFSYANIKPACILGVSGTISTLGADGYEWEVLNRYGIQTFCEMPSVYGKNKLRTLDQEDVKPIDVLDNKDDWFHAITCQANEMASRGRATIVVLRPSDLDAYTASAYFKKVLKSDVLRESLTHRDREFVIKKAALPGHTTFISEAFGRGSDFFCFDRSLQDNGGVHVVITFFPLERSLETQIDGRTARQGQKGSRSMILLAEHLSSIFNISLTSIRENSQPTALYKLLDKAREARHAQDCKQVEEDLDAATQRDRLSQAYLDAALAGAEALNAYKDMYQMIKGKPKRVLKQSRMVCLSDATGSMGGLWGSAQQHIREMLRRVDELGGDNLELLWVAYRDYSDGPRLLQRSEWTKDAAKLQRFVDSIVCDGGKDEEEAVEHALAEVRTEHARQPVTRVLLLGDAGAHSESKGTHLDCHGYTLQTDYRIEAENLARLGVPVFAFYMRENAKVSFTYIANKTGGAAAPLTDHQGLIDVVCENALEDIGGSELVAEYKAKYNA